MKSVAVLAQAVTLQKALTLPLLARAARRSSVHGDMASSSAVHDVSSGALEKIRELKTEATQWFADLEDWPDKELGFTREWLDWLRDVVLLEQEIEQIGTVYVLGALGTADFFEVVDEEFGDLQRTWQELKECYTHVKHVKRARACK
jgi:hypothetical protein